MRYQIDEISGEYQPALYLWRFARCGASHGYLFNSRGWPR